MKKTATVVLFGVLASGIYAQSQSPYDVNYDAPAIQRGYDEDVFAFQQIYLQYEDAVKAAEDRIREGERNYFESEQDDLIAAAVAQARQDFYDTEVENVRTQERERLTAEITEQLTTRFTAEYEQRFNQARAELAAEYEKQKNAELVAARRELTRQIREETETNTRRLQIVSPYVLRIVALLILAFGVFWLIKGIRWIAKRRNEIAEYVREYYARLDKGEDETHLRGEINNKAGYSRAEKDRRLSALAKAKKQHDKDSPEEKEINALENYYLGRLKEFKGVSTGLWNDIRNMPGRKHRVHQEALRKAEEQYKKNESLVPLEQYSKDFYALYPKRCFDNWNLSEDKGLRKGVCNDFYANINYYETKGRDLYFSRERYHEENAETKITQIFKTVAGTLDTTSSQVKSLINQCKDEDLNRTLTDIAKKYEELSEKFNKGKF